MHGFQAMLMFSCTLVATVAEHSCSTALGAALGVFAVRDSHFFLTHVARALRLATHESWVMVSVHAWAVWCLCCTDKLWCSAQQGCSAHTVLPEMCDTVVTGGMLTVVDMLLACRLSVLLLLSALHTAVTATAFLCSVYSWRA